MLARIIANCTGSVVAWSWPSSPPTTTTMKLVSAVGRLILLCILSTPGLAHDHNDHVDVEAALAPVDRLLWIHMALQVAVWGVLFPVGMVLGITRSRWHVPLQVRAIYVDFAATYLLSTSVECRHPAYIWRHCSRTHSWRTRVSALCPREAWEYYRHPPTHSIGAWDIPQASHTRAQHSAVRGSAARHRRQVVSDLGVGTDAVWWLLAGGRLLPGRSPWSMLGPLHHGVSRT
jgi:hypothetical protein